MKILIVDDDKNIRKMLERRLTNYGYEVRQAESGMEAIEILKTNQIGVVLLDQMMPEMDGVSTFEKIKDIENHPPAIMMTAHGSLDLAVVFMKAGGADFLQKPLDMDILKVKIEKALERFMLQKKLDILEREKVRLATLLETAAKLNHEINNPLSVIFNAVKQIEITPDDGVHIEKIRTAMLKIEKVVVDINKAVEVKKQNFEQIGDNLKDVIKKKMKVNEAEKEKV